MEVILTEKVNNLGSIGDKVDVKGGYGRNFLIPKGIAIPANKKNIERFEAQRAELEKKSASVLAMANERASKLNELTIEITGKAGDEGKLFGSISSIDIAAAFVEQGIHIEKRDIRMPEGAIRMLGEYEYSVHLYTDINANIKVIVEAE